MALANRQSKKEQATEHGQGQPIAAEEQVWNSLLVAIFVMALIILPQYLFTVAIEGWSGKNDDF